MLFIMLPGTITTTKGDLTMAPPLAWGRCFPNELIFREGTGDKGRPTALSRVLRPSLSASFELSKCCPWCERSSSAICVLPLSSIFCLYFRGRLS